MGDAAVQEQVPRPVEWETEPSAQTMKVGGLDGPIGNAHAGAVSSHAPHTQRMSDNEKSGSQ